MIPRPQSGVQQYYPAPQADVADHRLGWVDIALTCLFLVGLYTHYTPQFSATIPFPSAPAGITGILMLFRQRRRITFTAFATLLGVMLLYLLSAISATDLSFLGRRFNGFVQLIYSLMVGYGLFLTLTRASRRQIAAIFLTFSVIILFGCLLEDYGGLRPISDAVREHLYSRGIYDADLRDELLYGRIRPKFFASEPASVTFIYSLFCFIWMVVSRFRWKLLVYVALISIGTFAMPGPTLLLMVLLLLPYAFFIAGRPTGPRGGRDFAHYLKVAIFAAILLGGFTSLAGVIFPERMKTVTSGNDASFFYRVRGPAIATRYVFEHYPIAGAGLTGEPFIAEGVIHEYVRSPAYFRDWPIVSPASELVINFFFLHWIYLGLVWGLIIMAAVTVWLRAIGIPSTAFCWLVWAILGQAAGAYVGPTAWAVLYLAGAAALVQQRLEPAFAARRRNIPLWARWQRA